VPRAGCPACKTTLPLIATAYQQLKQRGKAIELVFVSLDKDITSFEAIRAGMAWPALPFGGTRAALLAEAFSVQAIPSLILMRADGTLVSTDGIRLMRKHTRGQHHQNTGPQTTP
jgi:nucleoredoxin